MHADNRERKCADKIGSAGSLGWPFPVLKCKYIFKIKFTEAVGWAAGRVSGL